MTTGTEPMTKRTEPITTGTELMTKVTELTKGRPRGSKAIFHSSSDKLSELHTQRSPATQKRIIIIIIKFISIQNIYFSLGIPILYFINDLLITNKHSIIHEI